MLLSSTNSMFSLATVALLLSHSSCLPLSPRDIMGSSLRILPLGDSITYGFQPNHHDGTNGYRGRLAAHLSDSHSNFNFVGTQRSGDMQDNYNEGHPGYTISQIREVMGPALDMRPNVVLLHAGTNDLGDDAKGGPYAEAPTRLGNLVDEVVEGCPDAVVLVAQITPSKDTTMNERVNTFNRAVPEVVGKRIDEGKKVRVVNMNVVGTGELADEVHPTDAGYYHMGNVWFEGIKKVVEGGLVSPPVDV